MKWEKHIFKCIWANKTVKVKQLYCHYTMNCTTKLRGYSGGLATLSQPNLMCPTFMFWWWEETGAHAGNPHRHGENMQTPHRKALPQSGIEPWTLLMSDKWTWIWTKDPLAVRTVLTIKPPCCQDLAHNKYKSQQQEKECETSIAERVCGTGEAVYIN